MTTLVTVPAPKYHNEPTAASSIPVCAHETPRKGNDGDEPHETINREDVFHKVERGAMPIALTT